jgi:hypothetical protein
VGHGALLSNIGTWMPFTASALGIVMSLPFGPQR